VQEVLSEVIIARGLNATSSPSSFLVLKKSDVAAISNRQERPARKMLRALIGRSFDSYDELLKAVAPLFNEHICGLVITDLNDPLHKVGEYCQDALPELSRGYTAFINWATVNKHLKMRLDGGFIFPTE